MEYLKIPLDVTEIHGLMHKLALTDPRDMMRSKEKPYKEQGLDSPNLSSSQLIGVLHTHPILLERPIVVTPKGARICRPPERVIDLI